MNKDIILAVLAAFFGGGGIVGIYNAHLSKKQIKANAQKSNADAEKTNADATNTIIETWKSHSAALTEQNKQKEETIRNLNKIISEKEANEKTYLNRIGQLELKIDELSNKVTELSNRIPLKK